MLKVVILVKRKDGMSFAEFDEYWDKTHGKVVMSVPEFTRYIRKYVQSHLRPDLSSPFPSADSGFDGYAELWFDDLDSMNAAFNEPRYLEVIRPDELKFIALDKCKTMLCHDLPKIVPEGVPAVCTP